MIELYIIPNIDQPWKRELIGEYASPEHCQARAKFTKQEVTAGLNGDLIQGKYILEFAPRFLHNLAIDYILEDRDNLIEEEISETLGITQPAVCVYLKRALSKLKINTKLREVLKNAIAHKNRYENIEIIMNKTIKIS